MKKKTNLPSVVNVQLPQEYIWPLCKVLFLGLDSLSANDTKSMTEAGMLMQIIMSQLQGNTDIEIEGNILYGFRISDEQAQELGRVADDHQTNIAVTLLTESLARRDLKLPLLDTYIELNNADEEKVYDKAIEYRKEINKNSFANFYVVKAGKIIQY